MSLRLRRIVVRAAPALLLAALSLPAHAQSYPNADIHFVTGFPPGSGADVITRFFAEKLRPVAGRTILVENKVGASGAISIEYVARSKPDGYTIFIAPASSIIPPARFLFKQLGYDPDKDLTSVALLATVPFILFVAGNTPIKSVPELVDYLRQKGDKATYGSSTTVGEVCAEMFKEQFGLKTTEVKYRSGLDGLNELIKNQLDFYFADPGTTKGMVADGRLRPLMLTTARRSSVLPDLPSARECGVKNLDLDSWWSAHVPAGTPAPVVQKLAGWLDAFAASDETKKFLADTTGAEPLLGGPKAVDDLMAKDRAKWAEYVRIAKIEPQ
jgi:tripartite-type tricarboxylate transporter receptor subunit TctC